MSVVLPDVPEDFDEFWAEARAEADAVPLEFHRSLNNAFELPGFVVEALAFRGMEGRTLHGWIAYPPQARRYPGFLWIPPYGRESKLPDAYGTRDEMVSLSFNFFGHDPFHQEKYVPERGYFAEGADDPQTWIFRRMAQDCFIAVRVLQAQLEADEDRLAAMGMSQGGGLAISCGAQCPSIRAVCADMPFLGGIRSRLLEEIYRYPLKELADFMENTPLGKERLFNTLGYFDTVNQATRCRVPTHVTLGLKDPASRPDAVRSIYEALPGPKALTELDWGHDWHPDMVAINRSWLFQSLG
ncbi:MAG TPA: acetylxylan esterase [Fimbriimonadaceae bacterium]|nr:acetylxylan esterase [Fimbriimonadaceae bacterium]